MNPLLFFWLFFKASLFSSGGMANLPSLYSDLTARHLAAPRDFAEALAIGQIAPGPNGLWSISLGYFVGGFVGSMLALIALLLPPMLILWVERIYRKVQDHASVERFVRGISLAVVGIFWIVLVRMYAQNGAIVFSTIVTLGAMGLGATRRVPVPVIIGTAAIAGILFAR